MHSASPDPHYAIERHPDMARMRARLADLDAADPEAAQRRREEADVDAAVAALAALVGHREARRTLLRAKELARKSFRRDRQRVLALLEQACERARASGT